MAKEVEWNTTRELGSAGQVAPPGALMCVQQLHRLVEVALLSHSDTMSLLRPSRLRDVEDKLTAAAKYASA